MAPFKALKSSCSNLAKCLLFQFGWIHVQPPLRHCLLKTSRKTNSSYGQREQVLGLVTFCMCAVHRSNSPNCKGDQYLAGTWSVGPLVWRFLCSNTFKEILNTPCLCADALCVYIRKVWFCFAHGLIAGTSTWSSRIVFGRGLFFFLSATEFICFAQ